MSVWLVLSHLAAFGAGALMWGLITRREVEKLTGQEHEGSATPHVPYLPRGVIYALLFAVFGLTLGVQQYFFQRSQHDLNSCTSVWGQGMTDTFTARSDATSDLDLAQQRRDDAVDAIIAVIISLRLDPPEATDQDFTDVLSEFAAARQNLDRVREKVVSTREDNPYPPLEC